LQKKVDKNINSLLFLYGENQVNFDLSFKEQVNSLDRVNNQMKLLVYKDGKERDNKFGDKNSLENVESKYLIQKIFSFINEKVKLELIRYNKKLQKKNDLTIITYKVFSGTYIIYDTKTKIKEYLGYNDYLIFEGEYLNGKRNGKGKEYHYNRKLLFEGEYLNGKRNGKGKIYNNKGKLMFEGEFLNGNRWNGKGYDISNNIVYELINGIGKVKGYNNEGELTFEGEFLNGEINGKGKEYSYFGEILEFEGEYLKGKRHGKCMMVS